MDILTMILIVFILYVVIQVAIGRSVNAKLTKENYKVLVEIRELLKKTKQRFIIEKLEFQK